MRRTRIATLVLMTAITTIVPTDTNAFVKAEYRWPDGIIRMALQFGSSDGTLADGSSGWAASAVEGLLLWNGVMGGAQFNRGDDNAPIGQGNKVNNVIYGSTVYGDAWDEGTLAVTLTSYIPSAGTSVEADVLFNSNLRWNSYRGRQDSGGVIDFRRVAAHEFGHVLGLKHPDGDGGQNVVALMNARVSDLDTLAADDINAAQNYYGRRGSGASVGFPARDLSVAARLDLDTVYRDFLGRPLANTSVDQEGSAIWTSDIIRLLLTGCSVSGTVNRVFYQIAGHGLPAPCGPLPVASTAFGFPGRDLVFAAQREVEEIYRDFLGRGPVRTWVDPEGVAVWTAEYLRYYTGGCSHTQSINSVRSIILLNVTPPLCR